MSSNVNSNANLIQQPRLSIVKSGSNKQEILLNSALSYAAKGYAVFPVHHMLGDECSCGRWDCKKGKHPRITKWQERATTDAETIKSWWQKWPNANIGIQTGIKSGLVVIDIDPRNAGDISLQNLVASYPAFNAALETYTVSTGGNGTHFYYSINEPFKCGKKHGLGVGIDVQGDGKYIVAPPSNHVSGGDYAVIKDINPKQLTKILIDLIGQQSAIEKKIDDVVEGGRNNWLAEIAGKALRDGKPANSLSQYLQEQNALRCKPPLDYTEVEAVVQSIIAGYDPSTSAVSFKTRWQELIIESNQKPIFKISCLALSTWMDKDGANCYPTIEQVANKCRMDRKTIGKHFDEAEKLGFFVRYSHSTPSKKGFNYGYVAKVPP